MVNSVLESAGVHHENQAGRLLRGWIIAFVVAFVLYGLTAAPTIQWQDSGSLVVRVVTGQLINPLGLALSHPLIYWLFKVGTIVTPLSPAHVASLVSAFFGACAVASVYLIGFMLTGSRLAAVLGAVGLMVANTFWRLSTTPESYTLVTALLLLEVFSIIKWDRMRDSKWLLMAFFANGVGLAAHNMALLTLPVVGIVGLAAVIKRQVNVRTLVLAVVLWVVGSLPFTGLVVDIMVQTGQVGETIRSALFGHFGSAVAGFGTTMRYTAASLFFTAYSFPNLALPVAALGIITARRAGIAKLTYAVLLADLLIHLAFVLRYGVVDQYTFLLPAYALLGIFSAIGLVWIIRSWKGMVRQVTVGLAVLLLLFTPVLYAAGPVLLRSVNLLGSAERHKPYRDDYVYLFVPWGGAQSSTEQTARQAADLAGPDGIIIAEDSMGSFGVEYVLQQLGLTHVQLLSKVNQEERDALIRMGRPVVLIPSDTREIPEPASAWKQVGQLYVANQGTAAGD